MSFSSILSRFMDNSPIPVMAQALLEKALSPEKLESCFMSATDKQYTRDLLFSSLFELMSLVVTKSFPSVNAAYQADKVDIGVSITSVYNKLNALETNVSAALVRDTALEMAAMVSQLNGACEPLLPGLRIKMLDGNCIEATEHRLKVLREEGAAPLPGKSLVIYDPALEMAIDVIPCEDGHAQERSLLGDVLTSVNADDVLIMDRNFCVRHFLWDLAGRESYFICRYHQQVPYEELNELEYVGSTETGELYEQWIRIEHEGVSSKRWRRIVIKLNSQTRDGDRELIILTNLSKSQASAQTIAILYRKRWNIETMFQQLESYLNSEINALGYPKAALFGFCVALVAYNVMAVVKASLRAVHGEEKVTNEISGYYIAGELGRTHVGMMIAILPEEWEAIRAMSDKEFCDLLNTLANKVQLSKYKKHRRGPKKPKAKKKYDPKKPHVSTHKLLKEANLSP